MATGIIRPLTLRDLSAAGGVVYRAFATSFRRYGYTEPIPSPEAAEALVAAAYSADPAGAIALDAPAGKLVGVAFSQSCRDVAFVGPLAVDPERQGRGFGRRLLQESLTITGERSTRLLQDAFNTVSFRLYARAGFEVRETLALAVTAPGGPQPVSFVEGVESIHRGVWSIRDISHADLPLVAELDRAAYGADRSELLSRLAFRMRAVILDGPKRPRGFACAFHGRGIWVIGPGWAEDGATLAAITVTLAQRCAGDHEAVAAFIPASRSDLLRSLLESGFRVSHLVNVMVRGDFRPFSQATLPVLPPDVGEAV